MGLFGTYTINKLGLQYPITGNSGWSCKILFTDCYRKSNRTNPIYIYIHQGLKDSKGTKEKHIQKTFRNMNYESKGFQTRTKADSIPRFQKASLRIHIPKMNVKLWDLWFRKPEKKNTNKQTLKHTKTKMSTRRGFIYPVREKKRIRKPRLHLAGLPLAPHVVVPLM